MAGTKQEYIDFDGDTVLPLIDEVSVFNNTILKQFLQTNCWGKTAV